MVMVYNLNGIIAVSSTDTWRNHIVSALETIKGSKVDVTEDNAMEGHTTEGNVMNDVTRDEATDKATVTVDVQTFIQYLI